MDEVTRAALLASAQAKQAAAVKTIELLPRGVKDAAAADGFMFSYTLTWDEYKAMYGELVPEVLYGVGYFRVPRG